MKFHVIYQRTSSNGQSPVRIVEQTTGREVAWINRFLDREYIRRLADTTLRIYFYCVRNSTRRRQHKGQHGSCCTRNRAILIRSVAIEWGLCRWARTLRPPRPEVGRYLGGA